MKTFVTKLFYIIFLHFLNKLRSFISSKEGDEMVILVFYKKPVLPILLHKYRWNLSDSTELYFKVKLDLQSKISQKIQVKFEKVLNSILTTKMFHKNASLEDPCFKYRWRWYRASTRLFNAAEFHFIKHVWKVFNTSKSIKILYSDNKCITKIIYYNYLEGLLNVSLKTFVTKSFNKIF